MLNILIITTLPEQLVMAVRQRVVAGLWLAIKPVRVCIVRAGQNRRLVASWRPRLDVPLAGLACVCAVEFDVKDADMRIVRGLGLRVDRVFDLGTSVVPRCIRQSLPS